MDKGGKAWKSSLWIVASCWLFAAYQIVRFVGDHNGLRLAMFALFSFQGALILAKSLQLRHRREVVRGLEAKLKELGDPNRPPLRQHVIVPKKTAE